MKKMKWYASAIWHAQSGLQSLILTNIVQILHGYYTDNAKAHILSIEKNDAWYHNMHTAAHRKIAALRHAADATARQIFLPCSIYIKNAKQQEKMVLSVFWRSFIHMGVQRILLIFFLNN